MSIGIYKITNPKGKIYIGQSINLEKRINDYKYLNYSKNQYKLYNSFQKYGIDSHIFEIIEICEIHNLNNRERYWQDFYDVLHNGLNLILTTNDNCLPIVSKETKEKIKKSLNNYFIKLGTLKRNEIYGKSSRKRKGCIGLKGRVISDETKRKISIAKKGHIVSDDTKLKIKNKMIGREISWSKKIGDSNRGKSKNKGKHCKPIIQLNKNGEILNKWKSISQASIETKIPFNSISNCLTGYCKTSRGFIWKYDNNIE
jgi:group I intron endonuclease